MVPSSFCATTTTGGMPIASFAILNLRCRRGREGHFSIEHSRRSDLSLDDQERGESNEVQEVQNEVHDVHREGELLATRLGLHRVRVDERVRQIAPVTFVYCK